MSLIAQNARIAQVAKITGIAKTAKIAHLTEFCNDIFQRFHRMHILKRFKRLYIWVAFPRTGILAVFCHLKKIFAGPLWPNLICYLTFFIVLWRA